MTLAADLAVLGRYNSTDITNIVAQTYDILSIYYGDTLTEDTSEDWDRIAKIYAVYLLDRLASQRKGESISELPMLPDHIVQLIKQLEIEVKESSVIEIGYESLNPSFYHWSKTTR